MHPHLAKKAFDKLFKESDGFSLSTAARQRLGLDENALTYGEITWDTILDILAEVQYLGNRTIFYDLGSGTGKAVIGAALLGTFERVMGIELLEELYKESKKILLDFNKHIRPLASSARQKTLVDFAHGDLFMHNWSDGDVIFCQTTCFNAELLNRLEEQLHNLKKGSLVITFSKPLISPHFQTIVEHKYPMSWGEATTFIQKKIR